jgi:adenine-specific DNA-methyltransferase
VTAIDETQPSGQVNEIARPRVPRLIWDGKPATVERVSLPFQTVEIINESRATREAQRGSLFAGNAASTNWRNKLVWGDNKLVIGSLLEEFAGAVRLVYIDPPFDTGADFSLRVAVGDDALTKLPSILEEHAYRDTWGAGKDSYLSMVYERLVLVHQLLAVDGSFYLHCAPTVSHYLKLLCDDVFGPQNFRSEIIWKRSSAHSDTRQGRAQHGRIHDSILFYTKGDAWVWSPVYMPYDEEYLRSKYSMVEPDTGRRYQLGDLTAAKPGGDTQFEWMGRRPYKGRYWAYTREKLDQMLAGGLIHLPDDPKAVPRFKRYLDEQPGLSLQDIWTDIDPINARAHERVGYPTQKPEALLERIIASSTEDNDLVADLFAGSGTTAVVAERLGRRWIVGDLGRFAVHTTRKRLLNLQGCTPFEILNLGSYERQHWQQTTTGDEVEAYLGFILSLYDAALLDDYRYIHGKKADRLVHVGAVDAPVTIDEIEQVMDELADNDFRSADILGWEWEMGLHDVVGEEARRRGLDVRCRQIPREVMKAEMGDDVRFFELAYVELQVDRDGHSARVQLRDFVIPSDELIPDSVRTKITQWSDYIDYWSVDFNFHDDTFHNEWQSYRTREAPKLATESDWHEYEAAGRYAVVVKVIDIFGNDTTKLAEVTIR